MSYWLTMTLLAYEVSRKPFISPHQSAVVCSLLTHHDDLAPCCWSEQAWHTLYSCSFSALQKSFSWPSRLTWSHKVHAYSPCPISDLWVSILIQKWLTEAVQVFSQAAAKTWQKTGCHVRASSLIGSLPFQANDWRVKRDKRRAGLGVINVPRVPARAMRHGNQ